MCHLHFGTHPCGCRDESRIVVCDRVVHHVADARCFETLSCRRRRRRWCARHQPATTTYTTTSRSPTPHPRPAAWEYERPEYDIYGRYHHSSYFSS
ncbi:hypothetical protein A9K55_003483 [Cordyceps militaris]|uniref:Uncharacterized protein n=1 Tax=Cordyceps militaris TaxID=73501 RepID=A0A2H4S8X1_CORMI|nr:hypothetical protein A9K55_003483 [Cordyceps militaris]